MLRGLVFFLFLIAVPAAARPAVIKEADFLWSSPGISRQAIGTVAPGAQVEILRDGWQWTRISVEGHKGFVATNVLLEPPPVALSGDPTCDQGYPYSGSPLYFFGLTAIRHSGILGDLLGTHIYRPC
jgi:hypothetical protein